MNKVIGLDYGRKKIGVAVGDTSTKLAEPKKVIRFKNKSKVFAELKRLIREVNAEMIVVGVSEGEMAKESRQFGKKLKDKLKTPVYFQDETLTTKEAQTLSVEAGIRRKKRRKLEDAYSATLILEAYLNGV